jgi:hypothetical protein
MKKQQKKLYKVETRLYNGSNQAWFTDVNEANAEFDKQLKECGMESVIIEEQ